MSNTVYSPIRHLAHALFLNHDPRRALMVMLNAYFDASASQLGTQVITMAGFVSSAAKWERFEEAWNKVLHRYHVPYFHMNEFTISQGAFKTWKGKEGQRKAFLTELIKVTKNHVHKGFASSILLDDFRDVNRDYKLHEHWGCEYAFVGMNVVSAVMKWKEKRFPNAPIKYIFESGDTGYGHLKRCLEFHGLPHSFQDKKEMQNGENKYVVPFQAADFAAWESMAAYQRYHDGHYDNADPIDPVKSLRQSFQAL